MEPESKSILEREEWRQKVRANEDEYYYASFGISPNERKASECSNKVADQRQVHLQRAV